MVGSAGVFLRTEVKCEETACRFKGNDHCEFTVDVSGAPVPSR
jgi:predicted hydrocarbon binding protein